MSQFSTSHQEYLQKYLTGDVKRKKKKKIGKGSSLLKRSTIIDDDIDFKSMRPLDDDEVDLLQIDEDTPQIAGIIDERPEEVKAQEQYNSKRWKVFGGVDGVNVEDSLENNKNIDRQDPDSAQKRMSKEKLLQMSQLNDLDPSLNTKVRNNNLTENKDSHITNKVYNVKRKEEKMSNRSSLNDYDSFHPRIEGKEKGSSDSSPPRGRDSNKRRKSESDSDSLPPRKNTKVVPSESVQSPPRKDKKISTLRLDSDRLLPRIKHSKSCESKVKCDLSPQRIRDNVNIKSESDSDTSPPRIRRIVNDDGSSIIKNGEKTKYNSRSNRSSRNQSMNNTDQRLRKGSRLPSDMGNYLLSRKNKGYRSKSDSDNSPLRVDKGGEMRDSKQMKYLKSTNKSTKRRSRSSSESGSSHSQKEKNFPHTRKNKREQSCTPPIKSFNSSGLLISGKSNKNISRRLSRKDLMNEKNVKRHFSDSDDSPPRRRRNNLRNNEDSSDMSPPRKTKEIAQKKKLYRPNNSSSSDEKTSFRKLQTTLDGKQAGLQDAKQLRKELSDLKTREDLIFSKMDPSVSGAGASAIKRDRKTGQIRDLEKEKETEKEKVAKVSVVNEKYSKWGRGLKQVEDAKERAAEALKVMNKPLARYADDEDLDNFLKAQEREGDPMLDYIKKKQKEATSLISAEKQIYQGAFIPNRFGIRPGTRWDGVVRSNGYESMWFSQQNAKKATDEHAYKWSTSDM